MKRFSRHSKHCAVIKIKDNNNSNHKQSEQSQMGWGSKINDLFYSMH